LTPDKNLPYQQNLALLIVRVRSNRIQDLLPIIPECLSALDKVQLRQVVRIGSISSR